MVTLSESRVRALIQGDRGTAGLLVPTGSPEGGLGWDGMERL